MSIVKPIITFNSEDDYNNFVKSNYKLHEYLTSYNIENNYSSILLRLNNINIPEIIDNTVNFDDQLNDPNYKEIVDKINQHKSWYNVKENYKDKLINTFDYIYNHISRGIFVSIRDNKINELIIFANPGFVNNWSKNLKFEDGQTIEEYYKNKRNYYRKEYIIPMENWYFNGFIVDNEFPTKKIGNKFIRLLWSNHSLIPILDMLNSLLQCRKINNCDFFINKRDHPILRKDLKEPYKNLYPEPTPEIPHKYRNIGFLPIFSFYGSDVFADVLFPCAEDWMIASGTIFLQEDSKPAAGFLDTNYLKYSEIKWEDKQPAAIFRGRGTGGSNLENNQRFQLAKFSHELNDKSVLDAGVISFNVRDKVNPTPKLTITYPKHDKMPFPLAEFVSMNQQMLFKYHLHVQGHAAINRTAYMLKSKSLIMVLEPQFPDVAEQWFTPILKENEDYVLIKSDLSDIIDKITWCREHDNICKQMTINAYNKFYKYNTKGGILNYVQFIINTIYSV